MIVWRRFLVLAAFAFWQGGFTFYAAAVVPIGTDVLGSINEQARITRRVTTAINFAGIVAIGLFAWDAAKEPHGRRGRAVTLFFVAAILLALILLRAHLDQMFHGAEAYVDDRAAFRPKHRLYLWLSAIQWAACVGFLVQTISAWRKSDRRVPKESA